MVTKIQNVKSVEYIVILSIVAVKKKKWQKCLFAKIVTLSTLFQAKRSVSLLKV